jgi:hypothetical protein
MVLIMDFNYLFAKHLYLNKILKHSIKPPIEKRSEASSSFSIMLLLFYSCFSEFKAFLDGVYGIDLLIWSKGF